MKHYNVDYTTELNRGDKVLVNLRYDQVWAEIYKITVDNGIITSHGCICRSEIEGVKPQTLHYSI